MKTLATGVLLAATVAGLQPVANVDKALDVVQTLAGGAR